MLNDQISGIVESFAKQNKWSKPKLMALAEQIASTMPQRSGKSVGRATSAKALEARQKLVDMAQANKGKTFTAQQIAQETGIDAVTINNSLRYLSQKSGVFSAEGHAEKQAGQRGRKSVIWKAN